MKKTSKKFFLGLFALAAFGLAACGQGPAPTSSVAPSSQAPSSALPSSEKPSEPSSVAPSSELPGPSSELPGPSSEEPSSELPGPSSELPDPSSEQPGPSSLTPTPSSEEPAPTGVTATIDGYPEVLVDVKEPTDTCKGKYIIYLDAGQVLEFQQDGEPLYFYAWSEESGDYPTGTSFTASKNGEHTIWHNQNDELWVDEPEGGDPTENAYVLYDVENQTVIAELVLSDTPDHQGRQQASALGVDFAAGTKFAIRNTATEVNFLSPIEGWSFGGTSDDDTAYLNYLSVGEGYWEVLTDFNVDIYAKFAWENDSIYFGLNSGEPVDPSSEEPTSEPTSEEPVVENAYVLYDVENETVIAELVLSDEPDTQGRQQASALGVEFTAGMKFSIRNTGTEVNFLSPVEGWSFGGDSEESTAYEAYILIGEGYWEVLQDFKADVYAKFAWENDSIYFGLVGGEPVDPSSEEPTSEEPVVENAYVLYDVENELTIAELVLSDEPDTQGRQQASALGVEFTAGMKFSIRNTGTEVNFLSPIEGWSFGGDSEESTAYEAYILIGEGYWEVLQDFKADVYAKFAWENDSIYFGLVGGEPVDPSSEEPTSEPTSEEPVVENAYALYDLGGETVLAELELSEEPDTQGRQQASALGVEFKAGTKFTIRNTGTEVNFLSPIEGWSFGGDSEESTAYEAYILIGEGYWEVLQDFKADVYAKFAWENDSIYFGLVGGEPVVPSSEEPTSEEPAQGETADCYVKFLTKAQAADMELFAWIWTTDKDGAWYYCTPVEETWSADYNLHYTVQVADPVGKNVLIAAFPASAGFDATHLPTSWDGCTQSADTTFDTWGANFNGK